MVELENMILNLFVVGFELSAADVAQSGFISAA